MKFRTYFLSLLIIILFSSLAFAEGERVDAKCEVGISNKIKEHRWHGLYVTLTNKYPLRKDVLVTVYRKIYDQPTLVLNQSVTLDSGERPIPIKLEFLCPPVKNTVGLKYTVYVVDKSTGRTLMKYYNKRYKKVKRNDKEYWIGRWFEKDKTEISVAVLSQNEEQIITVNANNSIKLIRMILENADFQNKNYILANRQMDDLPTNWLELQGVKLIILNNPEISKLQYSGRDKALEDWVRAGGTLILMLSEKSEEYKSLPLTKLAGVQLKSITVADRIRPAFKTSYLYPKLYRLDGSYQCIEVDIIDPETTFTQFWAYPTKAELTEKSRIPIVNVRYVDAGKIYTVLLDVRNSSNSAIPQYLFESGIKPVFFDLEGTEFFEKPEEDNGDYPTYSGTYTTSSDYESEINLQQLFGNSINNIQQAKPIKFGIIAAFIGIYMIVVAFIDFMLLKFMSLLHWTWLSVLIWVVAFSAIADRIGETFRGGDMSVRELVVVDSGLSSSETSTYHQFSGIFSQQNQSYTVYHESDKSGITRLERLVDDSNDEDDYFNPYNPNTEIAKNKSVDSQTEFKIAQPSDADEIKYGGAYLKSVILPRWVIRDLQSDSIIKNKKKSGVSIEYSGEEGFYDLLNDVYSDVEFALRQGRKPIEVSKVTVTNNYPYPLNGLCIIYSNGKIATYAGHLNPNDTIDFFYNKKEDYMFSDRSGRDYGNENARNYKPANSSSVGYQDLLKNFRINNGGSLSNLLKKNVRYYSIFSDSRNEVRIPKDALLVLLASCRKILQRDTEKQNRDPQNIPDINIESQAFNKLDISHRIESGDTIVLSWTNWHMHENISPESENAVNNIGKTKPRDDSRYEDLDALNSRENQPMPTYKYNFPEIQFEGWKSQSSRFIVNRLFFRPLKDIYVNK